MSIGQIDSGKVHSVVYGAGKYAEILYHRFELAGRSDEIAYFLVSDLNGTDATLHGKSIFVFDEKKNDLADKNVIIAMSERQSCAVLESLREVPVLSLMVMSSEENRFRNADLKVLETYSLCAVREKDSFYNRCIVPRVSIVVPVYNSQKFLKQCMDSLVSQTLHDIEVICVDDGSTDESSKILDDYASRDGRIRVIHKSNSGYGNSINVGAKAARGKYIGIVESDDYVARNMFERLYLAAEENDLDMVKAECYFCWDNINYRLPRHVTKMNAYYNQVLTDADRDLFFGFFMNTWSGIYRRNFLEEYGIVHHETPGASFQDNGFWLQTMFHAQKAMWLTDKLYYYRQDNENASVRGDAKAYEMSDEFNWAEEKLGKQGVESANRYYLDYFRLLRNKGNLLRISDEKKREFYPRMVDDYKKYGVVLSDYPSDAINQLFQSHKRNRDWCNMELLAFKSLEGWYKGFMSDPDLFVQRIIENKKQVVSRIEQAKRVYIVGTNPLAQRVMRIIYNMGLFSRIAAFIGCGVIEDSCLATIPVLSAYDPDIDLDGSLAIVGADRNTTDYQRYVQILDVLKAENRMESEDITDNFYWIF